MNWGEVESIPAKELMARKDAVKNADGTWSFTKNVDLSSQGLTELPLKFKSVGGFFDVSGNKITSLEGAPEKVGAGFYCEENKITSVAALKGMPKKIGGNFNCVDNDFPYTYQDIKNIRKASKISGEIYF